MRAQHLLFAAFLSCQSIFAQVGINTITPDASSVLDVSSDTKGMIVPRLTTANITTLGSTASEGMIVYDKDLKIFKGWNGTKWQNLSYEPAVTSSIFEQGFETTSLANYTLTGGSTGSFAIRTGNSGTGDAPSSSPYFSEGSRGIGYTNSSGTVSYIEFSTVDASAYTTSIIFSFDLAAFSLGNTNNGLDPNDAITIDVSIDGGSNYVTKLTVTGGNLQAVNNTRWAFTGTGIATNTYSASNITVVSPNNSATTPNTYTGSEALTKLSVTGLPNSALLKLRISVKNNSSNELWVIDNVKLQGS